MTAPDATPTTSTDTPGAVLPGTDGDTGLETGRETGRGPLVGGTVDGTGDATGARKAGPAPVAGKSRIRALDVVRGFALLGILGPNIIAFGWPSAAMADPSFLDSTLGVNPWNAIGHDITSVFFLGKMMALFSMLFGAGVVIYARKFDDVGDGEGVTYACQRCNYRLRGLGPDGTRVVCPECGREQHVPRRVPLSSGASLWYRRIGWLFAIGMGHALLLWFGDILVLYSLAGCGAVWWVRRWDAKLQIGLGVGLHLVTTLLMLALTGAGVYFTSKNGGGTEAMMGNPAIELAGYAGSYLDTFRPRLVSVAMMWFLVTPLLLPGVTGLMMMGMGLTRLGVLTGERSTRLYGWMAGLGLVGGISLTAGLYFGLKSMMPEFGGFLWQAVSQFVGIPISLGYMAMLILLVRAGALAWLTGLLANVGRMAMSNYLLQTVLCTTFFYGYGGGYFATIDYPRLFLVIAAVWSVNIVFSAVWLRAFRFGPAEWVWRSLTYWKIQPLRR